MPINAHLYDHPAPAATTPGLATMGLHVRYPDGAVVPVSVSPGNTPRAQWDAIHALGERYTLAAIQLVTTEVERVRVITYVKRTGEVSGEPVIMSLGAARRLERNTRGTVDVVVPLTSTFDVA